MTVRTLWGQVPHGGSYECCDGGDGGCGGAEAAGAVTVEARLAAQINHLVRPYHCLSHLQTHERRLGMMAEVVKGQVILAGHHSVKRETYVKGMQNKYSINEG